MRGIKLTKNCSHCASFVWAKSIPAEDVSPNREEVLPAPVAHAILFISVPGFEEIHQNPDVDLSANLPVS